MSGYFFIGELNNKFSAASEIRSVGFKFIYLLT